MKVSERLAALHIASLWCIAVAQPLFDVLRGSPEFFVAHDATPADLVGLVLLFCLAGPAIAALALWIVGRLAPGWRAGATGIMVGSLAAAVVLAALKPLGVWDPGLPLALAAGCGGAAGFAYIRLAPLRLFATFLSPALVVVPAAFLLTPGIAGLLAAADEESALDVAFGATPPVVIVIFDGEPRVLNLILDTTVALLGATAAGFHGLEHTEARAFRWTTREARINVPIDPEAPPATLAVDVVMTGQPKWLRIEADGCVLFDDTISSRWAESFALDSCRLTPP